MGRSCSISPRPSTMANPAMMIVVGIANQPSYKPEYMAKVKQVAASMYNGTSALDPQMDCRPMGIPRAGIGSMQVVQTPQQIAILYEGAPSSVFRIIYMDGRSHPADLDTTFMGDSIGHWEGDTLVVDVDGLNDETRLEGGARARHHASQ